ncbi:MAG: hypothetical protein LBG44_05380 [Gemmatimonadota bacterium]|jgi:hypothetical protein|nr:hypothetical protein [Gemmatimonadota bacterium]
MNPLNGKEVAAEQQEVVISANGLMQGTLPFLEGVRKLVDVRSRLSGTENDPDFLLFVAIESQADHIPNAEMRALCSQSWLEKCDAEVNDIAAFYQTAVMAACERLVRRFSHAA